MALAKGRKANSPLFSLLLVRISKRTVKSVETGPSILVAYRINDTKEWFTIRSMYNNLQVKMQQAKLNWYFNARLFLKLIYMLNMLNLVTSILISSVP